jgi:hypothetical protein
MVTPKRSMSTEGETLQVSVLPYRCSICALLVTRQMPILFQSSSCDTRCKACRSLSFIFKTNLNSIPLSMPLPSKHSFYFKF